MKLLQKILDVLEVHINAVIFMTLFLSMVIQVIMRYVFDHPSPLLHEITMISFVWTVYLSASLARRERKHIRFNIIYDLFPKKVKLVVDLILDIFVSILLAISFFPVVEELKMYGFIKAQITGISWTYIYMIVPIFFALVLIHNAYFIYRSIRDLREEG